MPMPINYLLEVNVTNRIQLRNDFFPRLHPFYDLEIRQRVSTFC